jgi:putative restriction endonuclease
MPQSIPEGLTREHILRALDELDAGEEHPFGTPTGYELLHDGRSYPPKAVIGLAHRQRTGGILEPLEFSGGEASGQANSVLRRLGFTVVYKRNLPEEISRMAAHREREHRMELWNRLLQSGGPIGVAPGTLRELGIYGGAQGIWVDKARTGGLTADGNGVTVSVLHTGQSYADELAEDCVLYHYPRTRRPPRRDASEVNATKSAGLLGLPLFVVTHPSPSAKTRDARLGWIEAWNDELATFLMSFDERPPVSLAASPDEDERFQLVDERHRRRAEVTIRDGQQRFKFHVLGRYGPRCAACGLDVPELLDAAHLCPKSHCGSDDARNGLVLCVLHHRALDVGLIAIEPETLRIVCREPGPDAGRLGVMNESLAHLRRKPHVEALRWNWEHRRR